MAHTDQSIDTLVSISGTLASIGLALVAIGGLTGDQRFFIGFAQVWRTKLRDNYAIELTKTDPHSIPVDRVLGTAVMQRGRR